METIKGIKETFSEKITDFMDKAPGLVSLIVTFVILFGIIG